jgi:hypothetical protein
MPTKSKLAQRASKELTAAADGFDRAGSLFRAIFNVLVQGDGCSQRDAISLAKIGSELCETRSPRSDGHASYFEDVFVSLLDRRAEDSSQGGA